MSKHKKRKVTFHNDKVYVADAGVKGRGVFARVALTKGEAAEAAPVLVIPRRDVEKLDDTFLADYCFSLNGELDLIGLGFASLYNHSFNPNAYFILTNQAIFVRASRPIAADEEVMFDYGWTDDAFRANGIPVPAVGTPERTV